jgi:hypothetical protein
MIIHGEPIESEFEGTIIDLETIGNFEREFKDSRQYRSITPVIFGLITKEGLMINCARNPQSMLKLQKKVHEILPTLPKPFYAFNCHFEQGVLFHYTGQKLDFLELQHRDRENKERAITALGIDKYKDPFNGDGYACSLAWQEGKAWEALAHNRACLLKERDLLLRRGAKERQPLDYRL